MERSLRTRINAAKSVSGVNRLLKEGRGYKFASDRTRRRWEKAAKEKVQSLGKE